VRNISGGLRCNLLNRDALKLHFSASASSISFLRAVNQSFTAFQEKCNAADKNPLIEILVKKPMKETALKSNVENTYA